MPMKTRKFVFCGGNFSLKCISIEITLNQSDIRITKAAIIGFSVMLIFRIYFTMRTLKNPNLKPVFLILIYIIIRLATQIINLK
jgi:hypothetical protein